MMVNDSDLIMTAVCLIGISASVACDRVTVSEGISYSEYAKFFTVSEHLRVIRWRRRRSDKYVIH